jgi:hypothetical protein
MTKEERAQEGIFFTPKKVRDILFNKLADLHVEPRTILEPSFGTGEFILDAKRIYPDANILGVEKNEALFHSLDCPDCDLTCGDFLIIGNPPYFVLKEKHVSMTGRPNIYVVFLYKCLTEHLEADGVLAFIVPTSLYNCSYYQPMRDYIQKHTTILQLENLDKPGFYETAQETALIVLRKNKVNDDYIFNLNGHTYISPFYTELYNITQNTTTLNALGLLVKTGNIVWNQVKPKLSDEGTLLIYSSNIKNSELRLDNLNGIKKQYVRDIDKPTLNGPVILVERGYGNTYKFNNVLVTMNGFYAENHINVIYANDINMKNDAVIVLLQKVIDSFNDPRSLQFIRWFIGNGSVSSSDLEKNMPIFI